MILMPCLPSVRWHLVYTGKGLRYTVPELLPGTRYAFHVIAVNKAGQSKKSDELDVSTTGEPPGMLAFPFVSSTTVLHDLVQLVTNEFKTELREENHWLLFAPIPVACHVHSHGVVTACTCFMLLNVYAYS